MTHKKKEKKKRLGLGTLAVAAGGFLALIGLKGGGGTTPPPPPPPTGTEVKIWFRNGNGNATTYITQTNYGASTATLNSITSATGDGEVRMPVRLQTDTDYFIYGRGDSGGALAICMLGTEAESFGGITYDPANTQNFNVFVNDANVGFRATIELVVTSGAFTYMGKVRFAPALTAAIGASAF